jgi:hypothetical protein
MSLATFGVTYSDVARELQGWETLSDISADIAEYITSEAAGLSIRLRHMGYDPETVQGWGASDSGYVLSRNILIHRVTARTLNALQIDKTDLSQDHMDRAQENETLLRTKPESLSENSNPDDHMGSPETNVSIRGRGRDDFQMPRSSGPFWDKKVVI